MDEQDVVTTSKGVGSCVERRGAAPWTCPGDVCVNTPDPEEHHCGIPLTGGPWSPSPGPEGDGHGWGGDVTWGRASLGKMRKFWR